MQPQSKYYSPRSFCLKSLTPKLLVIRFRVCRGLRFEAQGEAYTKDEIPGCEVKKHI